jgi:death-on-curing protein
VRFLSTENVLRLHAQSIEEFGGASGLRDRGMLESAVSMPQATFGGEFLHPDLPAMAGAYLYHLSQAHPFIDGNKRTAMAAALVFVSLNGAEVVATDDELIALGLGVASSEISKDEVITRLRSMIRTLDT